MKSIACLALILLMIPGAMVYAQDEDTTASEPDTIIWYHDYDSVLTLATQEGRHILMEFYTDW